MIENQLKKSNKPAYLFVGSGFSRRYIDLETWEELLKKFSLKNYVLYSGKSRGDLPLSAKYIAEDIFEAIYKEPESHAGFLEKFGDLIGRDGANALKCKISVHLEAQLKEKEAQLLANSEIEELSKANIDGIITTNWDCAIEKIFPKFTTFVGQEELLFKSTFGIGEIYKIHGCSSKPESLILTSDDYYKFSNSNAYVAAKLTTIFVEHPVIFIGYSISDSYLIEILLEIVKSLGRRKDKLSENLYFLRRPSHGETDHVTRSQMPLGEFSLPITQVVTNDFKKVYQALSNTQRKIPAHVLRMLREQIYEITQSSTPEKRVALVDIDDNESLSGIDFVAGFAVKEKFEETMSTIGLKGLSRDDLMKDILFNTITASPEDIIKTVIPNIRKGRTFVPVYKYLKMSGIENNASFISANINWPRGLPDKCCYNNDDYYARTGRELSLEKIEEKFKDRVDFSAKAILGFPFEKALENLDGIEKFLINNYDRLLSSSYKSDFYKLICLYDHVKNGW
ncbi:SIR2 family protein [Chromobacterium sphagni]|uniref:SIR2 family protein n=1 Tax=Chromobacterium sphagni TaxID=1903179 RepID=UPI0009F4AFC7|nr:SIR2 family protein [Chromobacterium sphagni]